MSSVCPISQEGLRSSTCGRARATENLQRLFQGCDLCFACRDTVFIAHALIDTLWLELIKVALCCEEFVLRGLDVFRVSLELRLSGNLISTEHLNVLALHCLGPLRIRHKIIVCLLGLRLR